MKSSKAGYDEACARRMDQKTDALCRSAMALERESVRMCRSVPGYAGMRAEEKAVGKARLAALKTSTTQGEGGMRIKTVGIDADVEQVLRAARLDGDRLVLQGQLTSQMYKKVMKVLDLIGFKWNRSEKCHVGEGDSAGRLREALAGGKVVDEKKTYQFFETPGQVASRMAALAGIEPGHRVLEPSAGRGAIIDAILQGCPKLRVVFACDIDPKNVRCLKEADAERSAAAEMSGGYQQVVAVEMDFLDHHDKYDRIVMNPPFTGGQDVDHVLHAYDLLLPGGRLVAVMSPSWTTNTQAKHRRFRDWYMKMKNENGHAFEPEVLPAGTFKESGTDIETMIVVVRKPLAEEEAA